MAKKPRLSPPDAGGIQTPEDDAVELDLRDGVQRRVRFSIGTLRKLISEYGLKRPDWEDQHIPLLIWMGLHDDAGNPPADITIEKIEALGPKWLPYLGSVVLLAWHGQYLDAKPAAAPSEEPAEKKIPGTVQ